MMEDRRGPILQRVCLGMWEGRMEEGGGLPRGAREEGMQGNIDEETDGGAAREQDPCLDPPIAGLGQPGGQFFDDQFDIEIDEEGSDQPGQKADDGAGRKITHLPSVTNEMDQGDNRKTELDA